MNNIVKLNNKPYIITKSIREKKKYKKLENIQNIENIENIQNIEKLDIREENIINIDIVNSYIDDKIYTVVNNLEELITEKINSIDDNIKIIHDKISYNEISYNEQLKLIEDKLKLIGDKLNENYNEKFNEKLNELDLEIDSESNSESKSESYSKIDSNENLKTKIDTFEENINQLLTDQKEEFYKLNEENKNSISKLKLNLKDISDDYYVQMENILEEINNIKFQLNRF